MTCLLDTLSCGLKHFSLFYSVAVYTAIPPRWTDFPYADTCVRAEAAPTVAGSASAFQGLQSPWQLEPHPALPLGFLLALLPGGRADRHLVHLTVAVRGKVLEESLAVPFHPHFHLLLHLVTLL